MRDSIAIVSVKAKKNCYSAGDAITTDQFDIVTDPKGYENQVTVQPTVATNNAGLPKEQVELTFSLTALGKTSKKTTEVSVVNSDLEASVSLDPRFGTLQKKLESFRNCSTLMNNLAKKGLATGKFPGMKRKVPDIGGSFTTPSFGFNFSCCNDKEIALAHFVWNGFNIHAGIETYFPFFIPAVPGLNIYVSLEVSMWANLGMVDIDVSLEEGCSTVDIGIGAGVEATGSVGVSYINPKILGAQLGIQGQASGAWKWHILTGEVKPDPIKLQVNLVGKITFISMEVASGSWTLGEMVL